MEAKDCSVCERAWRSWTFSYFFSGFFRSDISGDQRSVVDRAVHPASCAHATLCVDGGAGLDSRMRVALFHLGKRWGSVVSQARWEESASHPQLGGAQRIRRHAGCRLVAAANSLQGFCCGRGRVRGSADQLHLSHHSCTSDTLLWYWLPGDPVWSGCSTLSGHTQMASCGCADCICRVELCALTGVAEASAAS